MLNCIPTRSVVKIKPLLGGKSGLYTVRPMKESEVIELVDSKVLPASQPPPSEPVEVDTDTAKLESKNMRHPNYRLCYSLICLSGPSKNGNDSGGRL